MASAYLFAMFAITPSESREVALIANPEFEAGPAAGHRARRLIDGGNPGFSDPFLLMAEDWVPRDAFSRHPHRGIETVTLVLDGALEHFDSAGNTGVIYTGDAQWMTAGRGVIHNENPLPGTTTHALQLWVNLPASEKMAAPRYQDLRGADLPRRREPGVEFAFYPVPSDLAPTARQAFSVVLLMTRPSRRGRYGLLEGSDGDERWLVRCGGSGNWRAGGSGVRHDIGKSEPPS